MVKKQKTLLWSLLILKSMRKKKTIEVQQTKVSIISFDGEDYISITDMA